MPETQSDDAVIRASIKMNTLLLLGKVVASVITTRTSPVIVATLVDSAIDVLIQVALYWANQLARPEEAEPLELVEKRLRVIQQHLINSHGEARAARRESSEKPPSESCRPGRRGGAR